METEMLIGSTLRGRHREPPEPILNPRTGATIARACPRPREAQIDAAVAAAEKAFDDLVAHHAGASAPATLLKIADRIEAEAEDFAALEALNCGKPINAVLNDEIPAIVDCWRFFAGAVRYHARARSPANTCPATPR